MSTETEITPAAPFSVSGSMVFSLIQDGWRRGQPVMVNQFSAYVQHGHECTPEMAQTLAKQFGALPLLIQAVQVALTTPGPINGRELLENALAMTGEMVPGLAQEPYLENDQEQAQRPRMR